MKVGENCPFCGRETKVDRIRCNSCGYSFEGFFAHTPIDFLNSNDKAFILDFILNDGKLKDLAESYGVTYPTIRARFDRVKENLKKCVQKSKEQRKEILDLIEKKEITPEAGMKFLSEL